MDVAQPELVRISVVVPVFRSAGSLEQLVERLEAALAPLTDDYEVILVDDGSPDGCWETMRRLKAEHPHLRVARSLANRGQQHATLAGFLLSRGEIVVTMDDDLQHPPEEIARLVGMVEAGNDLVIGAYESKRHSALRNLAGTLVDGIQRHMFRLPKDFQLTSFRAMRRATVERTLRSGGAYPHLTAQLLASSARRANVSVKHERRSTGSTGYTLRKSLALALRIIFGYSSYPLYLVAALCVTGFLFSSGLGAYSLWAALVRGTNVPGWASIIGALSFFNSLTLLSLLIFGLHLWRIGEHVMGMHPRILIDEVE